MHIGCVNHVSCQIVEAQASAHSLVRQSGWQPQALPLTSALVSQYNLFHKGHSTITPGLGSPREVTGLTRGSANNDSRWHCSAVLPGACKASTAAVSTAELKVFESWAETCQQGEALDAEELHEVAGKAFQSGCSQLPLSFNCLSEYAFSACVWF